MNQPKRPRRMLRAFAVSAVALVAIALGALLVYANVGRMDATPAPLAAVREASDVTLTDAGEAWLLAPTGGADGTGVVFVPGAKVDPLAYAPMLHEVAASGTTVVITKPPLRLAILDLRAPETFTGLAPDVESWAVGGHSLGGVLACRWADDPGIDSLILFASYCANDLAATEVRVLSIAGSEDGLSTAEKIAAARPLLPATAAMTVIPGASHASFGAYGPQVGDGTPTITPAAAWAEITGLVIEFLR